MPIFRLELIEPSLSAGVGPQGTSEGMTFTGKPHTKDRWHAKIETGGYEFSRKDWAVYINSEERTGGAFGNANVLLPTADEQAKYPVGYFEVEAHFYLPSRPFQLLWQAVAGCNPMEAILLTAESPMSDRRVAYEWGPENFNIQCELNGIDPWPFERVSFRRFPKSRLDAIL